MELYVNKPVEMGFLVRNTNADLQAAPILVPKILNTSIALIFTCNLSMRPTSEGLANAASGIGKL